MTKREFGVQLTRLRERLHLSIPQLAALSDIDYMQVSRYEKGATLPSLETALRLATVLRVSLDQLATGKEAAAAMPFANADLLERMRELDALPPERRELATRVLDALIAGELDGFVRRLRS